MFWFAMFVSLAVAQEAVKLEVVHTVHAPKQPALIVRPQVGATHLSVILTCSGVNASHKGPASIGKEIRIALPVPPGQHTCTGQLEGQFVDGTYGKMPLQFQVAVQNPIEMGVTMEDLDLQNNRIRVHLSQPISRLDIDVFGESGQPIGAATIGNVVKTPAAIQWEQSPGKVVRLKLTATGSSGMSTTLDLFPWSYKIPHEEVVFSTGSADIPQSETHKLHSAKSKIDAVLDRFAGEKLGFEVPMALYVAGYTDTVGNKVSNRLLSDKRAASLARWFRANGFLRPIHYQGFGESALAVSTADEVDEPANRRALYVIAAETPPTSEALPTNNWKTLR